MMKILDLFFPPFCLHCDSPLEKSAQLFCKGCAGFFELIDPSCRCLYCFSENVGKRACPECLEKKRWHVKMGAALDYLGPVASLVKKIKYGNLSYLAKTGAAFMAAQFYRLDWPLPDLILPIPRRHWFQGMNHASLLAMGLSRHLKVPCKPCIKRKVGDLSQARLTKAQRELLPASNFYLKNENILEDKILLLIDDVITTGTTIRHCTETLSGAFPKKIYALSLARTIS